MQTKFIKFCAMVMVIDIYQAPHFGKQKWFIADDKGGEYNPYDDLNQMAEVFDKLLKDERIPKAFTVFSGEELKYAVRNHIISTMDTGEDDAN